ncbi:hypothetical protein THAOC_00920, partial [Thalassiosira oceanica]
MKLAVSEGAGQKGPMLGLTKVQSGATPPSTPGAKPGTGRLETAGVDGEGLLGDSGGHCVESSSGSGQGRLGRSPSLSK